ncbi:MAG: TolC family protein [Muribaculaceae bacterium]
MTKLCGLTVLVLALCSQMLSAQQVEQKMSLEEIFALARNGSSELRAYATGVDLAQARVAEARAERLPEAHVDLSVAYNGNGLITDRDFGSSMKAHIPHFGNALSLEVIQPIYTGGAISSGIRLAEVARDMAVEQKLQGESGVKLMLIEDYLQIYRLMGTEKVIESNIDLARSLIANTRQRAEQGTVLRNDVTRHELQLETLLLNLTQVRGARSVANHRLCTNMGVDANVVMVVPDTAVINNEVQVLNEEQWQQMASEGSHALRQSALAVQLGQQQERLARAERLPKVSLVAADNFTGPITIEIPAINKNFNYWYVGLGVSYNIASLYKSNKKIERARIDTRLASERLAVQREQTANAVQAGYIDLLTAMQRVQTQQKSVELACQNYKVTLDRYENSLALLTDMIDAQNVKLSAEIGLVEARIEVLMRYYALKHISGAI